MDLIQAAATLQKFGGIELTGTLARVERTVQGKGKSECTQVLSEFGINNELMTAAALMKRVAGQINVTIHAMGILACLPFILETEEKVEYVSLGAGNTGRDFDLETNSRVAEFKFIRWKGGAESIRQNSIFKDFFMLARKETPKRKFLYVLGTEYPLRFLNGGRALTSILSRHAKVEKVFRGDFADRYSKVREYYLDHRGKVTIEDVSKFVPDLVEDAIDESDI